MPNKSRRDAVDEVLGGDSPVIGKIARQMKEAESARKVEDLKQKSPPKKADKTEKQKSAPAEQNTAGLAMYERPQKSKRVPMSPQEVAAADEVMAALGEHLGVKTEFAVLSRCLWSLLYEAQGSFKRVPSPGLRMPARADVVGNAAFEEQLAKYLLKVFQGQRVKR